MLLQRCHKLHISKISPASPPSTDPPSGLRLNNLKGDFRRSESLLRVLQRQPAKLALRIQVEDRIFIQLPRLGDIRLSEADIKRVRVLKELNFQAKRLVFAGSSFSTDLFFCPRDLRIRTNRPRTEPPASCSTMERALRTLLTMGSFMDLVSHHIFRGANGREAISRIFGQGAENLEEGRISQMSTIPG